MHKQCGALKRSLWHQSCRSAPPLNHCAVSRCLLPTFRWLNLFVYRRQDARLCGLTYRFLAHEFSELHPTLCIFTSLIRTRMFLSPSFPHTSRSSYSSSPPPLIYNVCLLCGAPGSIFTFPSRFLFPLCESSPTPHRLAGRAFMFPPLPSSPSFMCFETDRGAQKHKSAHSCQSCILPWGLYRELLSSFFKSTHPLTNLCTTATRTQLIESMWKTPIFLMGWIWKTIDTP